MTRRGTRGIALALLLVCTSCSLEPIDLAAERPLALRTTIRAADGSFLARLHRARGNRALVPQDRVPQVLKEAVLAAEDSRFFIHPGYDLRAIARAAIVNLSEGDVVQGGSTITQQYVKNTFFRVPSRTFERKARELRLAIEIERRYSKTEILNRYLNTVYFGDGAYGVKAAAETYFNERVPELDLREAALLAAVIKAPAIYDPRDHPDRARERRDYVLDRMVKLEMISARRAERARKRSLGVIPDPPQLSVREPYFVEAVKREILNDKRLGKNGNERAAVLFKGGLEIQTTLDPRIQGAARNAIASILNQPGDPEAALVAIEPKTGRVVAMIGGRDWERSQVNLALGTAGGGSGRQPGSSFKPLVVATALEAGIPLDALYEGGPAVFAIDPPWPVSNSEGTGSGLLSIHEALVRSVNGVFARLALQLGAGRIARQAAAMGVTARLPHYPSIALGSAEVSVLDMASAYATIANGGTAIEPTTIDQIERSDGEILRAEQDSQRSVMSPSNAYFLTRNMQQVIERGTGKEADIGRPAAGKTGTTDDYADAWFVGFTPDLVAAVWVGYPQGRVSMTNVHGITVFGGTFPAAIWREFMLEALRGVPRHDFKFPRSELISVEIDPVTGLLAAPWCPGVEVQMLPQDIPSTTCPMPESAAPPETEQEETPSPGPTTKQGQPDPSSSPQQSPEPEPSEPG